MQRLFRNLAGLTAAAALLACSGSDGTAPPAAGASAAAQAPGQIGSSSAQATPYAAARLADQASFGATPTLVAAIGKQGLAAWIDSQLALPPTQVDPEPVRVYNSQIPKQGNDASIYTNQKLIGTMLSGEDQLRLRVTWAMSQFLVVSGAKVENYATLQYMNLLQRHAFGNYAELIRALSIHPPMGAYLDNVQNRPTSEECPWCAPNENYARELLQLFTLGVTKLNPDGTVQRDAKGRPLETYTQDDVENVTLALTGWSFAQETPQYDYGRFAGEMVEDKWSVAHDRNAKKFLGKTIPAGGSASSDLDALVKILMEHPNIAPFVSLRMIQHLVTSNPSPAYVARMSAVFRDNGQGVAGDMKALVRAILLDPEARQGDQQGASPASFGKLREPLLWYTGLLRGVGCKLPLRWGGTRDDGLENGVAMPSIQQPFFASSVFSFYLPTDRAPGSNLLAPEQRLLTPEELSARVGGYNTGEAAAWTKAGCKIDDITRAYSSSPRALVDLISARYFRNAMPATMRQSLNDLAPSMPGANTAQKALNVLHFSLASPEYGAIR
ncbi:DUF1800 domain-containing protein [Pseudoduganella sp. OTU4001]|uniref:DUF1800 domain-containing protein n=1 Tax=Pseudoduganella sp. OTU4001 TaxID=3043854 RepID=UPI00313ABD93